MAELREHVELLRRGDRSGLGELVVWFLPGNLLQDPSMENGWVDRYMELASRFDRAKSAEDADPR